MKAFVYRIITLWLGFAASVSAVEFDSIDDLSIIQIYQDNTAELTADTVLNYRSQFTTIKAPPSYGTTSSHIWMLIEARDIPAGLDEIWFEIDNPSLDHINVYRSVDEQQAWQLLYQLGDTQPYGNRPIESRAYVVPFVFSNQASYLIEVYGSTPLLMPLSIGSPEELLAEVTVKESVIIFLFGIIFSMTIYNLVVFVGTRYSQYGWYCVYMLSMGMSLVFSSGIGSSYLWRDNFWLQNQIGYVFFTIMLWGAFNFVYSYLSLPKHFPRFAKYYYWFAQLPLLLVIPLFISKHLMMSFISFFMLLLFISGPILGVISWIKRVEGALIYLISWTIMVIALGVFNLAVQGFLDGWFMLVHAAEFGVAIESVLLSFALVYRMRKLEISTSNEIQKSHDEVELALAQVVRSDTAKDAFMTSVGHQLKTPIHLLMGNLQLISEDLAEHNKYGSMIQQSDRSATELLFRIDNLMTYSQIVADDIRPLMQQINIRTEFKLLESKWKHLYEQPNMFFEVDFDPKIPMRLEMDWVHLRKVYRLALEHMLEVLVEGRIHVSIQFPASTPASLMLNVQCSGHFFDEQECEWFNAQNTEQCWGSDSLELFMTRNLVKYLGAQATMRNTEFGAEINICCPVKAVESSAESSVATLKRLSVLVVDDIELNLKLMKSMLNKLDVDATLVDSGEKAIELVSAERFDLVLMDCQMPGLSGQEATKQIRLNGASSDLLPVIAVSANDSDLDRESCFYAGMNDFLAKPVRLRALEQKLKDWQYRK